MTLSLSSQVAIENVATFNLDQFIVYCLTLLLVHHQKLELLEK